jgi:hypothetical protein
MILCGTDVLTDRWFRLVIRLLALMAWFTSTVVMMSPLARKLCGLIGALKSIDGAWIVLRRLKVRCESRVGFRD